MSTRTVSILYRVAGAKAAQAQMAGMASASGAVATGTAAAATGTARAGQAARTAGPQMAAAGAGMSRAASGAGLMSARFLGPAGVIEGLRRSASAAIDFEESAIRLRTQIGLSEDAANELSSAAREIGVATGIGAQEAVDASFFIASAGLRGTEAMDALEVSAKGAAVGLGETGTIADLITSAMNAYGSDTLDAAGATDTLLASVKEGKAEAPEMAAALGSILPIASEMGVSFNEVGAAMASMTRTGSSPSEAITGLRGILVGILRPAEGAAQAMDEMGISAAELRQVIADDPEMGLFTALEMIQDATGGNEDALARLFPRVQGMTGVMDLMGASADETRATFEELADSTGGLDEAFDTVQDTTRFKMDRLFAEIGSSASEFGELLQPAINAILDVGIAAGEAEDPILGLINTLFGTDFGTGGPSSPDVPTDIALPDHLTGALDGYADSAANAGSAAAEADGQVGGLNDELTEGASAAERAAEALDEYMDALKRATDPVFNLISAIEDVESAQDDYNEAVKEYGKESDEAATASLNLMQRIRDLEIAAIDGDLSFQDFEAQLHRMVDAGHLTADQAAAIRDRVAEARGEAERFQGDYNANVTVRFNTVGFSQTMSRIDQAGATANFRGLAGARAGGGPVQSGRAYLVGEHGPELIVPGASGSVVPAPQTKQALRGGDGASMAPIHVYLDSRHVGTAPGLIDALNGAQRSRSRDMGRV